MEFYFLCRSARHLLSHRYSGNTVSRQFRQLHNNNLSILSVCHILQNHVPNIKPPSCLLSSKHGSQNSCVPSSSFVVLLAKQPKCRVESWVSLAPGLYWCLLSRRLIARGMLLVYLALHSIWWLINSLTFLQQTHGDVVVPYCRHTVNDFSPWTYEKSAVCVFCVCLNVCVRSRVTIRNDHRLLWWDSIVGVPEASARRGRKTERWQQTWEAGKQDEAGRLWQYEYNAMCVSSKNESFGWNPHTKIPIIQLARYNTIGWSDLYAPTYGAVWLD